MFRVLLLTVLLASGLLVPVQATIIQTYSSSTVFSTAFTQMGSTITFETIQPNNGSADFSVAGLTVAGVNFAQAGGDSYSLYTVRSAGSPNNWGTGAILVMAATPAVNTITLPQAVTAIGFSSMTMFNSGGTITINLPDGSFTNCATNVYTTSPGTAAFCGLTSSVAFTSFNISAVGGRPTVDNFVYGDVNAPVSETPEIATILMIGFGLLSLRCFRRLSTGSLA